MKKRKQNWGKAPWEISFRGGAQKLPDRVDFAVVGGGFAGLSAAAWSKRIAPEKSVVLLEAKKLGNGASGRTGGMALAQTAAGDLPELGDVLRGYREILKALRVNAELKLPGAWEVARGHKSMEGKAIRPLKNSPIDWNDSGRVRAVGKVPGGTVNPGMVVSGLARAATSAGAQIMENAQVFQIEFGKPIRLHVKRRVRGREKVSVISAEKVLLTTNAGSLELSGELHLGAEPDEPKLTFAVATARLRKKQIAAIGMKSGRPFYSVDYPYLWGRLMENGGLIFGSGLVPVFGESVHGEAKPKRTADLAERKLWSGLEGFDVRKGEAAERIASLVGRLRRLHPTLKKVKITHRWCGPILLTKNFVPVFRPHPGNKNVIVLGGFSGHGVALSVYLGRRAAEAMVHRKALPKWRRS